MLRRERQDPAAQIVPTALVRYVPVRLEGGEAGVALGDTDWAEGGGSEDVQGVSEFLGTGRP